MFHATFWSLLEKGGQQGLSLFVFLLLARLLGPEDYGLANVCFIFFSLATMITNSLVDGIVSNQIQDEKKLSVLFWGINIIGLCLSLLCTVFAPLLSNLMHEPKLVPLLISFSPIPLLISLASVPTLLLLKELDFKVYAIRSIISTIVGGAVGIYMALNQFGAYSIVGQQIVIYVMNNLILWSTIKWRPTIHFNKIIFFEEIKPGLSLMGVNVMAFINEQLPRLVIGVVLGAASLGYYALATRLRFSLTEMLITSLLAVVYPALAKFKNNPAEQSKIAGALIYPTGLISFPIIALAVATAPIYVPLFFGDKWISVIPLVQIYIGIAVVAPSLIIIQQLFRSNNKMASYFKVSNFFLILNFSTTALLLAPNGMVWMGVAILFINTISILVYLKKLNQQLNINISNNYSSLICPALFSLIVCLSVYAFDHFSENLMLSSSAELVASIILGSFIYVALCYCFQKDKVVHLIERIRNIKKGNV